MNILKKRFAIGQGIRRYFPEELTLTVISKERRGDCAAEEGVGSTGKMRTQVIITP